MSQKKKKKKRVYSKDKARHIETKKEIKNPMQLVTELQRKENIWSKYIDEVIYQGKDTGMRPDEDLRHVLSYMKDSNTRKSILRFLMKNTSYNPFKDSIPTDILPPNFRVYVERIQSDIRFNVINIDNLPLQERRIHYHGKDYLCVITEFTKKNFNKELFASGYDFIILQKEGRFLINTNPKLKQERPSLVPVFEELDRSEPNTWFIHGHGHMIMTKHGVVSNLNLKQIMNLFRKIKSEEK